MAFWRSLQIVFGFRNVKDFGKKRRQRQFRPIDAKPVQVGRVFGAKVSQLR